MEQEWQFSERNITLGGEYNTKICFLILCTLGFLANLKNLSKAFLEAYKVLPTPKLYILCL